MGHTISEGRNQNLALAVQTIGLFPSPAAKRVAGGQRNAHILSPFPESPAWDSVLLSPTSRYE